MRMSNIKSKYFAKKVEYDGIKFDSKKEYERYLELRMLERANEIENLSVHVPYTLFPKSKYGREIKYIADFQYFNGEETIVEDVKSKATITPVYKLKKRILAEKYGIIIHEYL